MNTYESLNENVYFVRTEYKDIFTTVYLIKTEAGALLFDAASYDVDIRDAVIPMLESVGVSANELKYVFISHGHADHAGGLAELLAHYPDVTVITPNERLRELYPDTKFLVPEEYETVLGDLKIIFIPGHTADSEAILDTRTNILISGDCLQLYGIVGSGNWASNINYPAEHRLAVKKLRELDIELVATAHDYKPYGQFYRGKERIAMALDACTDPLDRIEWLIFKNPELDDEGIAKIYNSTPNMPTLASRIVGAVRREMK